MTKQELIKLLQSGKVQEFNKFIRENPNLFIGSNQIIVNSTFAELLGIKIIDDDNE